jgi:glycerophosphoryl diester phosphodiesterase
MHSLAACSPHPVPALAAWGLAAGSAAPRGWPARLLALLALLLAALLLPGPAQAFDLQGHRGARGLAPENSLPGFEVAIRHGVTTLELDLAVTRDGVVVIHHDLELNPAFTRDAQGQWLDKPSPPIVQMSWAELQAYDIGRLRPGHRYGANYPDQVAMDGTRVPRLADLLELVRRPGLEQLRLAVEIKLRPDSPGKTLPPAAFAQAVVDELRKAGVQQRTQILSFDWRALQEVQRIAPEIPTVYLSAQQSWTDNIGAGRPEGSAWTAGFQLREHGSVPRMIKAAGGRVWSVFHGDLSAAQVREAQALGLKVLTWTVNDAPTMHRMIEMGIDGLVTDRPDIAQAVLRERGITPR